MNKLTVLFGVLLCLVLVNARHYGERISESLTDDEESEFRKDKEHAAPSRHRRRRWQSNYGYDYPQPSHPFYMDRRDNYYNQQDAIQHILKLLDDISTSIKRSQQPPPPPPQPIYVPYPVPYYVPILSNGVTCKPQVSKTPNITVRFPAMEDIHQNWGFVTNENEDYEDESDGSRPISFDQIKPKQTMKRPVPKVEHGSSQAKQQPPLAVGAPNMCQAASLSCCGTNDKEQQRQCFTNVGCSVTFSDGNACSPDAIDAALESFRQAYSPVN